MSAAESSTIPYEKQEDLQTNRTCGAASLSMVYRSFGKSIPQAEIWSRISKHDRFGSLASTTHLMAQDALSRGFSALAVQVKHPLQVLRLCRDKGVRAILNHRLKTDSPAGHYTVLVDVDADSVVLHDPFVGPSRRLAHADLLELWLPRYPNAEIRGNMLIGVAAQAPAVPPCQLCGTAIPPKVGCPNCGKQVSLQLAALLGCAREGCSRRMWNNICCPACDHTWSFGLTPGSESASGSSEDPWNLNRLFVELDKFRDHVLGLPGVSGRSDIQQQLDFIDESKDRLRLAQTEELANRKASQARIEEAQEKAQQDEDAFQKKAEDLQKPAPPADGNALGQSLLKDLGLLA
jgi:peptidase C39-like protein